MAAIGEEEEVRQYEPVEFPVRAEPGSIEPAAPSPAPPAPKPLSA